MILKDYEEKNNEILNLLTKQKILQIRINENKIKDLNLSNQKNLNKSDNNKNGLNITYFSNFDLKTFGDKIKHYNRKILLGNKNISSESSNLRETSKLNEISNEDFLFNYYLNKKQKYDIEKRFNLFDIYLNIDYKKNIYVNPNNTQNFGLGLRDLFSSEPITFYEIFNFKSLVKNENGLMQNQLILIVKNNSLFAYDIYLNQLGTARFKDKIISLKTFKNQEGIIVFLLFFYLKYIL